MKGDPYNPRFLAYAKAHGRTPEEQERFDHNRTQKGQIDDHFTRWCMKKTQEYKLVMPKKHQELGWFDGDAFTAWLLKEASVPNTQEEQT